MLNETCNIWRGRAGLRGRPWAWPNDAGKASSMIQIIKNEVSCIFAWNYALLGASFTGTSHHLKKRVCPSLRPSIRPSICPLVRPYFFLSIHPSFCTSLFFKSAKTQKIKCILQREIYEFSTDQIDEFVGLDEEEWGSGGVDDQDANNNICRRPPPHYSALWVETL